MRCFVLFVLLLAVLAPPADAERLTAEEKHAITMAFLEGNPEQLSELRPRDASPDDLYPFLLYEHWWRRWEPADLPREFLAARREAKGLTAKRLRWINVERVESGQAYPMPKADETDPWPVISALVQDRLVRESGGLEARLAEDPLGKLAEAFRKQQRAGTLGKLREHQLWWIDLARNDFSYAYQGDPPTTEQQAILLDGEAIADRNLILAIIALILLLAVPLFLGRRAGA